MRDWTFSRRITAGFTLVVAIAVVIGVVLFIALQETIEASEELLETSVENAIAAARTEQLVESKVAEVRGFLLTQDEADLALLETTDRQLDEVIAHLLGQATGGGEQLAAAIRDAESAHDRTLEMVLAQLEAGDPIEDVLETYAVETSPIRAQLRRAVTDFSAYQQAELAAAQARAAATADRARLVSILLMVGAVVLAVLCAGLVNRWLGRSIGGAVGDIQSASAELQTAASQQASSTQEQTSSMNEIATTITELLATSRQIADAAQRVARAAQVAAEAGTAGDAMVQQARSSMDAIRGQVDVLVRDMVELGDRSQRIGAVLDIVSELAEQTNILAINASIEAAGAGEAGARFGVVADEIRSLADRVGASTQEIRELIDTVRSSVNGAVMATEVGSKAVDSGSQRFADVTVAFERVSEAMDTTSEVAREIELSTKQQSSAVEQVNLAITNVAQASQETDAATTQTVQTARELTEMSRRLQQLVNSRAGR